MSVENFFKHIATGIIVIVLIAIATNFLRSVGVF